MCQYDKYVTLLLCLRIIIYSLLYLYLRPLLLYPIYVFSEYSDYWFILYILLFVKVMKSQLSRYLYLEIRLISFTILTIFICHKWKAINFAIHLYLTKTFLKVSRTYFSLLFKGFKFCLIYFPNTIFKLHTILYLLKSFSFIRTNLLIINYYT